LTQFQFSGLGGGRGARGRGRQAPPPPAAEPPLPETVLEKGVTMWGASATGKTSFLAALYIALLDQQTGWRLRGDDTASVQELTRLTNQLTNKGVFPQATRDLRKFRWSLVGGRPVKEWHWYGPRRRNVDVVIPMPVVDVSGEVVDADEPLGRQMTEQFVESLADSTGIVFFYDPIREFERGDAFQHTFGVLAELDARMKTHGRLPHHVAVCVTKFDEQRMLDAAVRMGLVDYELDPPYSPRVMEQDAREFFARICGVSKTRNARRVLSLLEGTFDPGRIRYFVTSAIGFYVDPVTGLFNPRDFQQHIARQPNSNPRIRGDIQPINIVEPITWLANQLTGSVG
jgi:hypothetical protein